jgi:hypothetical protein
MSYVAPTTPPRGGPASPEAVRRARAELARLLAPPPLALALLALSLPLALVTVVLWWRAWR